MLHHNHQCQLTSIKPYKQLKMHEIYVKQCLCLCFCMHVSFECYACSDNKPIIVLNGHCFQVISQNRKASEAIRKWGLLLNHVPFEVHLFHFFSFVLIRSFVAFLFQSSFSPSTRFCFRSKANFLTLKNSYLDKWIHYTVENDCNGLRTPEWW